MAFAGEMTEGAIATRKRHKFAAARAWFFDEFSRFGLFWTIFIGWFGITLVATQFYGDAMFPSVWVYFKRIVKVFFFLPLILSTVLLGAFVVRKDRSITGTINWFSSVINNRPKKDVSIFMGCFLYWKMKIPLYNPFSWDETFAQWDAFLLGGRQAWDVIQPYVGFPEATRYIDTAYSLWALFCAGFWIYLFTSKKVPVRLRDQYWMATLLAWLLIGLVAATYFSSVGPVFYHHVTGDYDKYAAMFAYFSTFDTELIPGDSLTKRGLIATTLQNLLWGIYDGWLEGTGGISAMPSMHNAQALLFVLVGFRLATWFGWVTVAFLIVTFIGSVHLGWHYMVDGLLAFVLVIPIWYLAGWLTSPERKMWVRTGSRA